MSDTRHANPAFGKTLHDLIGVGVGTLPHDNRGMCPDEAGDPTARDPDCRACRACSDASRMLRSAEDWRRDFLHWRRIAWRGIDGTVCAKCVGSGVVVYGQTCTWHGGMGGNMCTPDVCDACWGSGSTDHPWTNLRALHAEEAKRIAAAAATMFADRLGATIPSMHPALADLAGELGKLARGRKARPQWFNVACEQLAKLLTEFVGRHTP